MAIRYGDSITVEVLYRFYHVRFDLDVCFLDVRFIYLGMVFFGRIARRYSSYPHYNIGRDLSDV